MPLLQWSQPSVSFDYLQPQGTTETETVDEFVTISNVSPLPLKFMLKAPVPFSLSKADWELEPEENANVAITMNPGYKGNLVSCVL